MENNHLTRSTEGSFYKPRKQPLIIIIFQDHEKPLLPSVSWHGRSPEMEREEHTGSYFGLESRRAAWQSLSPAEVWGARKERRGRGAIRSTQPAAVCVASLSLHMSVWVLPTILGPFDASLLWRLLGRAVKEQTGLMLKHQLITPYTPTYQTTLLLKCMHTHISMHVSNTADIEPHWYVSTRCGLRHPTPTERWLSFVSEDHCAALWRFLWRPSLILFNHDAKMWLYKSKPPESNMFLSKRKSCHK